MNAPEYYAGRAAEAAARTKANRIRRLSKALAKSEQSRPLCDCGNPHTVWRGNRSGHRELLCDNCWLEKHRDCIKDLYSLLNQLLPQIGNASLKDYDQLNRAIILAEKLLEAD